MDIRPEFSVDQVSWHTRVRGNPETRRDVIRRFTALANFLDGNGLTVSRLLPEGAVADDSFGVRVGDLTAEGLELIKMAYTKWIRRIDRGQDCTDVSVLQEALLKLRSISSRKPRSTERKTGQR